MTEPDTAAPRPIDVPCPTCGVAKWTPCQGTEAGTGYLAGTTEPHPARVEAARATTTAATRADDLRIDIYRGGETWVRVTHMPTGEVVNVDATKIGTLAAREYAVGVIAERLEGRNGT